MVKESLRGLMAPLIQVLLLMTGMMVKVRSRTKTAHNILAILSEDLEVDMVFRLILMETSMRENF